MSTNLRTARRLDVEIWKLAALVIIFSSVIAAQFKSDGWNGISPLNSSKTDVERLLGKPIDGGRIAVGLYDTKTERVTIWYSTGTCRENPRSTWNVARDIVTVLLVAPKTSLLVSTVLSAVG